MGEQEAKQITQQFVDLSIKAFKGDVVAQHCVMACQQWFTMAKKVALVVNLISDLG